MKFKLAVFILKAYCYIAFPITMIIVGTLAILKMNPITVTIGVFFIFLGCIAPFLAYDLIIKHANQIIQGGRKRR